MTSAVDELWAVARSGAQVDAAALARAVEEASGAEPDALATAPGFSFATACARSRRTVGTNGFGHG